MNYIAYSDLDGTFLDHFTYSYKESVEGLELLKKHNIPLIFISSKTFAEMELLSTELESFTPFIFENGGGYGILKNGEYEAVLFDKGVEELIQYKDKLTELCGSELLFFDTITVDEVVDLTGLSHERAALSLKRKSSLPFVCRDSNRVLKIDEINSQIQSSGIQVTRGGRFYHFFSSQVSKGLAVERMNKILFNEKVETMGVGDSLNDLPLLRAVDHPYLVKRHDNTHLETGEALTRISAIGPAGFSEAVKKFIGDIS